MKTAAIAVGLLLVAAIATVLLLASTRPDTFKVQRSARLYAPPEKIVATLADFRAWEAWSPWEHLDPQMKRDYSGAATGKGAVYTWKGNSKVGEGRMQITDVAPNRVGIDLDFLKPFPTSNKVEFDLQPKGEGTDVTWSMAGPLPFLAKIIHVFVNMDRMVGEQFETGLASLKSVVEKR
jgi:hypothetical protein